MTRAVWKYPLEIADRQQIVMPRGARILSVQIQRIHLALWALVDPTAEVVTRTILMCGTGKLIVFDRAYQHNFIATVQDGDFVWHFFERME